MSLVYRFSLKIVKKFLHHCQLGVVGGQNKAKFGQFFVKEWSLKAVSLMFLAKSVIFILMTSIVGFYEPIDVISSVLKIKIALLLLRFEVTFYTILSNMYEHHTLVECIEHNRGRGL